MSCLVSASAASAGEPAFQGLGDLPGGQFFSVATDISANGGTIVGYSSSSNTIPGRFEAFRWTATGMVGIGDLPGGEFNSQAFAVSANGSVITGRATSTTPGSEAFRWTQAGGMQGLGHLGVQQGEFAATSFGEDISADGSVIVGRSPSLSAPVLNHEAFRWVDLNGNGLVDANEKLNSNPGFGLGDLPGLGGFRSEAFGVSADGSIVVGLSVSGVGEAFRWTQAGGMVGLGFLPNATFLTSQARGVSDDGLVVVGDSNPGNTACRWTPTTGIAALGVLPGHTQSIALAASADGSVIVGRSGSSGAFVWDANNGIRDLKATLENEFGLDLTGWTLTSAEGVSADGLTIVGGGQNPSGNFEAFRARLVLPDDDGDGVSNSQDQCPSTPPDEVDNVDAAGCSCASEDTTDPTIECPPDVVVPTDAGSCMATNVDIGTPDTGDNCAVDLVNNNAPASYDVGDTIVFWTVIDVNGRSAHCEQTVTVVDQQDPTITCPADITVAADPGACTASGIDLGEPDTDDNCGVDTITNDAPTDFTVGTTTVNWVVTDVHGRTAECEQTVTVTDDEDPTITCPPDVALSTDVGSCTATGADLGDPTADDNCGINSVTNDAPDAFPIGETTVTWTATDLSGRTASCQQTVTVSDNEPPTFTTCPPDRTLAADANCEALVPDLAGEATVTDNCDGNPTLTQSPPAGSKLDLSGTQVSITATDASGNTATCTVTIAVNDNGCNDPPPEPDTPPDTPPDNQDQDGVDAAIEDAAPNNGDGNSDGMQDSAQDYVTSLPNADGNYITIAAPAGTMLANVTAGDNPSPGNAPTGVEFPAGFLSFQVLNLPASGVVDVQITVHDLQDVTLDAYWKHGPEPDNQSPHWYDFAFNGTTGATFNANVITLRFVDGMRGDGDLAANGVITDPGAPARSPGDAAPQPTPSGDCGTGACGHGTALALPLTAVGMGAWRRRKRRSASS